MSWGVFGQIVLLLVIYAFVRTAFKCSNDCCCKKGK